MSSFLSKLFVILLVFILLVFAPLMNVYLQDDLLMRRVVLNEVTLFIDKVTDKGSILTADIDDLYLGVNSAGGMFDVDVTRHVRIAVLNVDGTITSSYFTDARMDTLNKGDVVRVRVRQVGNTGGQRLLWSILGLINADLNFTLAGSVR